ncbi:FAD-dependent urate hydroxylase [Marinomonas gallaica]|uniref:FAD-dependent urate hydroxylase n=1 Tax=Marinomonas gallaica TaxID=1806667 RepID=A0A1C3JRJ8_9GAMM|nr:FAD-dependent monooxygenase [Marinomonas gallaica]SBT17851.1 FAD-dependent urate hydroxylase [Marinomonas gallaica]SBT22063.1 FAD-dependent urate hydroxylase [Marinomonas gallaica]
MKTVKHMAIIGAGVAGLALAILARKQGIQVTLFEQNKDYSTIGAGVTLWPNATFVIEQLGLMDEFQKHCGRPRFVRQFDPQSTLVSQFDIGSLEDLCGLPTFTVLRQRLIKILASQLKKHDIAIHFDTIITPKRIPQLQQQFDLVVGCDGRMHSPTRHQMYQGSASAVYQGFINIIGISDIDLEPFEQAIHDYRANGERFGIVPVANQQCYWAAAWPCALDRSRPVDSWYEEMQQRFGHWPSNIQQVLNTSRSNSLKRIFVHDLDPLPYWHRDNLVIIGDAAHAPLPTSGQGAGQALEDAWHLSQRLNEAKPLNDLLTGFYKDRIHKTTMTQQIGRQIAQQIFHQTTQPTEPKPSISAHQLKELYMQGLHKP